MEDKLYLFKKQILPLWNETKSSDIIQKITSPFYVQELNPTHRTINMPKNISKIYVSLIGGGGSGSLGEHRILHNTISDQDSSYPDSGYKNIIPLAGSGGGGGATIFRMPVVFRQKNRKTLVEFEVGTGGESREIRFGNRIDPSGSSLNYPESQSMKEYRKGRNGGDSKMILRQYDLSNNLLKEAKIKAMGGAGGGAVGYFITRGQIINMNSSDFNYIWDWSPALESEEGSNSMMNIPGYTNPPYLYWSVRKSEDQNDKDYNILSHLSIAAENYTAITRIPSYIIVAFHREFYYPIQDPGFRNDYISYNLLTHGESGITYFDYYKPKDTITIGDKTGYFSQSNLNDSDFGDFTYKFDLSTSSNTNIENFSFLAQYNPYRLGVDDRSSIGITRSKSDQLFGHPRYYLRTGYKYHYKDRTINLYRTDLDMPYNYPMKQKIALTSPEIPSLVLDRWSTNFKLLMSKDLPGPLYEKEMIKGEQGAFGGAGGGFLSYDKSIPTNFHGLYGGRNIKSPWNQLISGSGGRPYPRNIWDTIDFNELSRLKGYENAYFYYGGKGYSSNDAISTGGDSFITNHMIAGSGGGTIDYINTNHYISARKYNGPPVTFKDIDPLVSEGTTLKTYDGIFQWFKNNYGKVGTGGKITYQGWDPSFNPISKLYMNDKYGKHNISFLENGEQVPIEELLYIFGGGAGGGKAFYFEPGSGQESPLIEPNPPGIGCGSGGSCSLNEDGKSAVRGIPPFNVNWYLHKMLHSTSECKNYTEFADTIYTYTVTTLVAVMSLNIAISIIIDVFGGWVSSFVLSGLKTLAKGASLAIKSAFLARKVGRFILSGLEYVSMLGKKVSNIFKRIGAFFASKSSKSKILSGIKNISADLSTFLAKHNDVFEKIGIVFGVLTNDWSFLGSKTTKFISLVNEAEKIKDIIKNIEKLEDTSEKITKLEKLNKRFFEISSILGDKINYKKLNPRKFKTLNWISGSGVDDFYSKVGKKIDNHFNNYTKSISKVSERRIVEIQEKIKNLPDVKKATSDIGAFKMKVYEDLKKLSRPAEQVKYVENLELIYKNSLFDTDFWKEMDIMKQTGEFFTKTENTIGDAKTYFSRINNDNLPKLSSTEQREILFDMSTRPISTTNPKQDLDFLVDQIKNGPFTIDERAEILNNIFLTNQESFFRVNEGKNKLFNFQKIQQEFGNRFYFDNYFKNNNRQLYLYIRGAENIDKKIPTFNLLENLSRHRDSMLAIDDGFKWDAFNKFDSGIDTNHSEYCSQIINNIHKDPEMVKFLLNNPSILKDENKFGLLFKDIHASFLAKASSNPENIDLILKNLDKFILKSQDIQRFRTYVSAENKILDFAIKDGDIYWYSIQEPDNLFRFTGEIEELKGDYILNNVKVKDGVITSKTIDLNHIRIQEGTHLLNFETISLPEINIRIQKNQNEYIEILKNNLQKHLDKDSSRFYRMKPIVFNGENSSTILNGIYLTDPQLEILDNLFLKIETNPDQLRKSRAQLYVSGSNTSFENKLAYYKLLKDAGDNPDLLNDLKQTLNVNQLPELNPPDYRSQNFMADFRSKIGTDYVPNYMNKEDLFLFLRNDNKKLTLQESFNLNRSFHVKVGDEVNFINLIEETNTAKINFLKKMDFETLNEQNFLERCLKHSAILSNNNISELVDVQFKNFIEFYQNEFQVLEIEFKDIFEGLFPKSKFKSPTSTELSNLIIQKRVNLRYGDYVNKIKDLDTVKYISLSDQNKISLVVDSKLTNNDKISEITKILSERNKKIQKKFSCS
jgi:hypothetical protein